MVWINTAIAVVALLVASGALVVSYLSYNLNTETISLSGTFTYDCFPGFGSGPSTAPGRRPPATINLCWKVIVANQSTARISIVDFASELEAPHPLLPADKLKLPLPLSPFGVRTDNGKELTTPLVLDGGEARAITVSIPVSGTPLLEKLVKDFVEAPKAPDYSLMDFAYYAAQNNLDVLGNPVEKRSAGDFLIVVKFPTSYKGTTVPLRLKTGRGNTFSTELRFPLGPTDMLVKRAMRSNSAS
jgi:hypothetical protein